MGLIDTKSYEEWMKRRDSMDKVRIKHEEKVKKYTKQRRKHGKKVDD